MGVWSLKQWQTLSEFLRTSAEPNNQTESNLYRKENHEFLLWDAELSELKVDMMMFKEVSLYNFSWHLERYENSREHFLFWLEWKKLKETFEVQVKKYFIFTTKIKEKISQDWLFEPLPYQFIDTLLEKIWEEMDVFEKNLHIFLEKGVSALEDGITLHRMQRHMEVIVEMQSKISWSLNTWKLKKSEVDSEKNEK